MATISGRRKGVPAASPKFFKIIVDPKADLRIPAEFTKRYGNNLPNRVLLKVPTGSAAMEVELNQCNGKTMLQKGWHEFKERYSIGFGHFSVFEYNGKSQFNVLIFDMAAVEINYPFDTDYKKVTDHEPESDDPVVLLEEFSRANRGKVKVEKSRRCVEILDDYPVKKSHREMQNLSSCYEKDPKPKFSSPNYHSEPSPDCRVKLDGSTCEECSNGTVNQYPKRVEMQRVVVKETTSIAYQKAIAFASCLNPKNPFFIRLMHRSYVSHGFSLGVPLSFARRNFPCGGANSIIMVTNRKKWSVRCLVRNRRADLSGGWKGFVQDNGLKAGDACIFVVAENTKRVWNVVVFRS